MKIRLALLALVAVLAVGCRGKLPDEAQFAGESLTWTVDRTSDTVNALERDHKNSLTNPALAVIGPYAERAGFAQAFERARGHIAKAKEINRDRVQPLLKENRPEDGAALIKEVDAAKEQLRLAKEESDRVAHTRTALLKAASDLPSFASAAAGYATEAAGIETRLAPAVQGAKKKHPAKGADLDRRLKAIREIAEDTRQRKGLIDGERAKPNPDLLAVVQADERGRANSLKINADAADLEKRIGDLDLTITRRLEDMKLDYEITFARSSWDEGSDYGEEEFRLSPVVVTPAMAQDLSNLGGEQVDVNQVRAAGADPFQRMLPSHNSYEFWIDDVEERAYHRYFETVDGQSRLTDWMPVSDEVFERHEKDLGMEIYVKPYGSYADEALTASSPPGMALVGNPRYGRWQGDSWHWLPAYLFYSNMYAGNHYYRRDEWNTWSRSFRGRQPYYGRGEREEEREYGTNGRFGRVYYGDSHWGRSTGFRSYDVSFRGLGPEYRGGGPGGGGK
ncbi:MAG: hypothetical protein ACO1SV_10930 [Fimbriimonas sp.]